MQKFGKTVIITSLFLAICLVVSSCGGSSGGNSKNSQLSFDQEVEAIKTVTMGDEFFFGAYEQDNNSKNGKEPLEWITLYNVNGYIYAVSKYCLDYQSLGYHVTSDH